MLQSFMTDLRPDGGENQDDSAPRRDNMQLALPSVLKSMLDVDKNLPSPLYLVGDKDDFSQPMQVRFPDIITLFKCINPVENVSDILTLPPLTPYCGVFKTGGEGSALCIMNGTKSLRIPSLTDGCVYGAIQNKKKF